VKKKWYNYFVETDPKAGPAGAAASPRRVTDVVPDAEAEPVFTAPVADPTAFEEIYHSAKIPTPDHDYTVLKIAEMLQSEHIKALPAEVKKKSILVALDAAGVSIAEIVEDAVQRDRALDGYERAMQKHLEELRTRKDAENRALQEEITVRMKELRARIEANEKEVSAEQDQLLAWRQQKLREEDRIAEAIGYFVSENPVTRGGGASPDDSGGSRDVR
jgi:hypothetical protein